MKEHIEISYYKHPKSLLNASMCLELKSEPELVWFKVLEAGEETDGRLFISGYDIERMNRKIYIDDIDKATVIRG